MFIPKSCELFIWRNVKMILYRYSTLKWNQSYTVFYSSFVVVFSSLILFSLTLYSHDCLICHSSSAMLNPNFTENRFTFHFYRPKWKGRVFSYRAAIVDYLYFRKLIFGIIVKVTLSQIIFFFFHSSGVKFIELILLSSYESKLIVSWYLCASSDLCTNIWTE